MSAQTIQGQKRRNQLKSGGFTIIEMLLVLLLISLLASIVTPVVNKSILRAKEATLKENLFIVRKALDDYYSDKGRYPEVLKQLVDDRYLRSIPVDPISQTTHSWQLTFTEADSEQSRGIIDLHSLSAGASSEGGYYNEW